MRHRAHLVATVTTYGEYLAGQRANGTVSLGASGRVILIWVGVVIPAGAGTGLEGAHEISVF